MLLGGIDLGHALFYTIGPPPRQAIDAIASDERAGGRTPTRAETRCGCFLPDLTGLGEAHVRRRPPCVVIYARDVTTARLVRLMIQRAAGCPVARAMRSTRVQYDPTFKPVPASRDNVYTGNPLDRVAERRADVDFIATALASPNAIVTPVWRSQNLFRDQRARFLFHRGRIDLGERPASLAVPRAVGRATDLRPRPRPSRSAENAVARGSRGFRRHPQYRRPVAGGRGLGVGLCAGLDPLAESHPLLRRLRQPLRARERGAT